MFERTRLIALVVASLLAAPSFAQHSTTQPPDRKPPPIARADRPAANGLEVIREMKDTPGNIAVTPQGRVFVSMHPFGEPTVRVVEVLAEGGTRPYPSPLWAGAVTTSGIGIQSIIGIKSDKDGVLWMLDAGAPNAPNPLSPKLIAWDTKTDRLVRVIHLPPPTSGPTSFLQDLAIDPTHDAIYIADCGIGAGFEHAKPSIVVVYQKTGVSRRVLLDAPFLRGEPDASMVIDGVEVRVAGADGKPLAPRVGVNPITIDDANEWVYFGSMHGTTVWRVRAADLANPGLGDTELQERIEKFGTKSVSDGMSIDSAGNLYVTDVTKHAIGVVKPDGTYSTFIEDPLLDWPDGMSAGPDGHFYVVVNQLNRHSVLNVGDAGPVDATKPPYRILRFKPLAPATVGR